MGLIEKRMLAQLRDETVPKLQAQLQKTVGSEIVYDIDWPSFADNATAMNNLESSGLKPLNDIFRKIVVDELGKSAVREGVTSIRLSQGKDANISNFKIQKGALSLPWDWEGWSGSFFPDSVREKIESLL